MQITNGRYRHYKGGEYEVLGIAVHSETLEEMVIYKMLYDSHDYKKGTVWVRPAKMWNEMVIWEGKKTKRFIKINDKLPTSWDELVGMMDFIRGCGGEFLRFDDDLDEYYKYGEKVGRDTFLKNIKEKIKNEGQLVLDIFPYRKLLQNLPNVRQYTLWSEEGKMDDKKIEEFLEKKLNRKKYCWMERSEKGKSVPEIWHCHVFVEER